MKRLSLLIGAGLFAAVVLPVFAQTTVGTGTGAPTSIAPAPVKVTTSTKPTLDVDCAKKAVDTLNTGVSSAFSTYGTTLQTALTARGTAWKAALDLTGKARTDGIRKAEKQFKTDSNKARVDLQKARKTAWTTYNKDIKACRAGNTLPALDSGSEGSL